MKMCSNFFCYVHEMNSKPKNAIQSMFESVLVTFQIVFLFKSTKQYPLQSSQQSHTWLVQDSVD